MIGFGGHISNLNNKMREFRESSLRRREQREKVREAYRKVYHTARNKEDDKKMSDRELKSFREELRRLHRQSDLILVLTLMTSVVIVLSAIWYFFFR